jgi:N-acetylmuramoyl-L-alanine amidase
MHLDTTLTRFLPLPYGDEGEIPLWGLEHVRAVYKKGWMEGEGALFNPERSITRAEALTVISRMTGYSGGELYFNDSNDVPWWAASSIAGLVNAGIINGYEDNTIRPNDLLTRAEAAAILDKIM